MALAIAAASLGFAPDAAAQVANDPGAIERTIPQPAPSPVAAPRVSLPRTPAGVGAGVNTQFVLGSVHIEGATVFTPTQLSNEFEPYLATTVDTDTLKEIVARITRRYRSAGYILSYAVLPAQNVAGGIVRIAVVEGCVDKVVVQGGGPRTRAVEAMVARLVKEQPLNSQTLERVIGLIRDMPGMAVSDVRLSRSPGNAANHQLTIIVTHDGAEALVYADNRGTDQAGRERLYTAATVNSVVIAGDEANIAVFAIPGRRYHYLYGQAAASVPVGPDGWRIGVSASRGDQYQLYSFGRLDGASYSFAAQLSYPLVRSRALTAVARLSVSDWRSVNDLDRVRIQRDRLRVARVALDVTSGGKTRFEGQFAFARGLGFDGVTRRDDPLASRIDGSGIFSKASANVQLAHPLSKTMTLRANFAGQYVSRPVLSPEEFSLGGSAIGRAYDFNALTGDHGIAGGIEIGYRIRDRRSGPRQAELFSFADGGAVFQSGRQSSQPRSESLSSVGVGTRFVMAGLSFSAELGVPLQRVSGLRSARAFFSIAKGF
ncbi:ShlB/FhaC/HecB family hemolysin secretion/activation protein [Sphingomonas sp.]|uniref:ShlB/FhaC/HecB family hemolysin secretion/activation protein n=1 Tax=Sphingomonas sp. TaxID=28214 RepID=UPI0025DE8C8C|nr:ShlB/FhaC/HecB family hemolysin secretion/activation protein [Sphingomonas sp.]